MPGNKQTVFCKYQNKDVTYNEYNKNCRCARWCPHATCVGARSCAHAWCIMVDLYYATDMEKQCRACLKKTREATQRQR